MILHFLREKKLAHVSLLTLGISVVGGASYSIPCSFQRYIYALVRAVTPSLLYFGCVLEAVACMCRALCHLYRI
jgi:hypothetical protein